MCENICLRYGCSECCNPLKINSKLFIDIENEQLPFVDLKSVWIPEQDIDVVRLRVYVCEKYNTETGLCMDYENRPNICRNTKCLAFYTDSEAERALIIKNIKEANFLKLSM